MKLLLAAVVTIPAVQPGHSAVEELRRKWIADRPLDWARVCLTAPYP
jgi:hypothetical protein